MNHWFLCARDVMWVVVAVMPLILSAVGAAWSENYPGRGDHLFALAAMWQGVGIALLYQGAIK